MQLEDRNLKKAWNVILEETVQDDPEMKEKIERWDQNRPSWWALRDFYSQYVMVVYCSGFRYEVFEAHEDEIRMALKDYDVQAIAKNPCAVRGELLGIIGHQRKADAVIRTALDLAADPGIWTRLQEMPAEKALEEVMKFPGIGPKNRYHLLKVLGWDVPNHDGFTGKLAEQLGTDCDTLIEALAKVSGLRISTTETVLWYWSRMCETDEESIGRFLALICLGR